jgi:hypothetical protein
MLLTNKICLGGINIILKGAAKMEQYKNLGSNSGVSAYEIGDVPTLTP